MTSLPAGSPKCNCKNPDTCIHSFTLKVKDRTFTYKQNGFVSVVNAIAEGQKTVPLSLSLVGKQCVSHNPLCPQGAIYNNAEAGSLKPFNKGLTDYQAHYNPDKISFFDKYDSIDFLIDYVLAKNTLSLLPTTSYTLRVGQCRGEPFVNKSLNFLDGLSQIFNFAPKDALWTYINIYPEYKWEVSLVIGTAKEIEEFTDRELKKQQRVLNAENGVAQRGHRGWTRLPKNEITDSLEIEGKLSCKLGSKTHDYSAKLKQEFKKKATNLPFLDKAKKTLDVVGKALSTGKGGEGKITILYTEIIFPKLEIKGGGELKEDASSGLVYIERQVSLGLAPLIGLKMTLDLLQAFAAWYKMDVLLAAVREGLMSKEQAYNEGGNAAFIGMKFELVAEGAIDLKLAFKSDAKNEWEWEKTDSVEAKLSLTLEANVRAGVRFYIANGALTIGGKAVAEGCLGLDNPTKDKMELVLYHNGITAKVYVSYTVGLSSDAEGSSEGDLPRRDTSTSSKVEQGNNKEKEWIIHEKLEKKTQNIASILASMTVCFLLIVTFSVKAEKMNDEKYLFSFKTHKSTCILRVNNFPAVDSVRAEQGTMSAGFNLTAFLEDGSNNIELLMGGVDFDDPKTLFSDSSCEVIISKDTNDSSVKIAEFKLNVNKKGEISAGESKSYKGGEFSSKIVEGISNSKADFGLYKAQSDIILSGLPKWSWTKATLVTDNDLPAIRKAYENMNGMIKNRDIEGLKKITRISNDEMGLAEGASPAVMFISTDFPQHVIDKSLTPVPIQWDKYKLVKYRDGKLFRLAVGYYQNSPLKFQNNEGKVVFTYNPYFSIIDGEVTLVR